MMENESPPLPPWRGRPWGRPDHGTPDWRHKRRFLFRRFARLLAFFAVFVAVFMAGLAFLFTHLMGGSQVTVALVWLAGCSLMLILPLLMGLTAAASFRSIANPLAHVMAAADAVAEGDLSVRVPESGPGEMRRLGSAFNRMISELERADRQRRNLTADVAHELRTPVHILQGNLEGLLDGVYQASPEQINLMLDETRRLRRLVEDLHTLSLVEAGQLPLEHAPVDIGELLADAATGFSAQAQAGGLALKADADESQSPLIVTGDAGRLDQVLGNLITNALRHTPPGGAIYLQADRTAGGVRIRVNDTGEGIPAEDLPFIFDRFWRGDRARSRSRAEPGAGLGLAIARQLIQAHGGQISAASQPGQVTTFTIELPEA